MKPGPDYIDFELTGQNVGDKAWGEPPWAGCLRLVCLQAGDKTKVGLGRFIVVTDLAIDAVSAYNPSGVWEKLQKLGPLGTRQRFALPRDEGFMDRLGNTRLRLHPAAPAGAGVYLLADYEAWPAVAETTAWLRSHALAYYESGKTAKDAEIVIGLTSQKVTLREKGDVVGNVSLNGEDFLAPSAPFTPVARGKPFFYQEQPIKRNLSQKDDFVSRLAQAYGRAEPDEMNATGYRIHKENRPLSRLLYIIPTDANGNRVEKQLTVDAAENGGRWQTYTLTAKNGNSPEGRALYFTSWQGPAEFLVDDVVLTRRK